MFDLDCQEDSNFFRSMFAEKLESGVCEKIWSGVDEDDIIEQITEDTGWCVESFACEKVFEGAEIKSHTRAHCRGRACKLPSHRLSDVPGVDFSQSLLASGILLSHAHTSGRVFCKCAQNIFLAGRREECGAWRAAPNSASEVDKDTLS